MTEKASTRIAKFAFDYARKHDRKKIHAIHKANIMKMSDGLFLRCAREVAKDFPEITYDEHIVDNTCMQLVMNPYQYDMLLLRKSLRRHRQRSVRGLRRRPRPRARREPGREMRHLRGGARLRAGHRRARTRPIRRRCCNPRCSCCTTSTRLKRRTAFRRAMDKVYAEKTTLTRDVGGTAGTQAFADAVHRRTLITNRNDTREEDRNAIADSIIPPCCSAVPCWSLAVASAIEHGRKQRVRLPLLRARSRRSIRQPRAASRARSTSSARRRQRIEIDMAQDPGVRHEPLRRKTSPRAS